MKSRLLAIILSSLGFVAHASEGSMLNKEEAVNSANSVVEHSKEKELQSIKESETVDMEKIESEMSLVHNTDF